MQITANFCRSPFPVFRARERSDDESNHPGREVETMFPHPERDYKVVDRKIGALLPKTKVTGRYTAWPQPVLSRSSQGFRRRLINI
jgi:hypothetical protein